MRIRSGITNYYVYGTGLLYESDETAASIKTAFYHYDCRGSTVTLTDTNGNPTDVIEYSPYGTTTYRAGTNDTPFLYNGRFGVQTDPNGLLYMRARYYNPYICRFINPDPSGFKGGLNFYQFADGNPISLSDPFGLCADSQGWGGETASWIQNNVGASLNGVSTTSTTANFAAYMAGSFVNGLSDLLRLGQGTADATYNAQNGWDVAIGVTQDIQRAAGITTIVGGAAASAGLIGDTAPPVDNTSASTPVGASGSPITVQPGANTPTTINGIDYTGHALDSMQSRGIPPSAVQNTIQQGVPAPGNTPLATTYYDPANNLTVVTDTGSGRVITVHPGRP